MKEYAEIFHALADTARLRMIRLLADTKEELCVCEFVDSLEIQQYNVSKHIKILRQGGLVNERKEGRWVYYSLTNGRSPFMRRLVKTVQTLPDSLFAKDKKEFLKRLKVREGGKCLRGILKTRLGPKHGK